MCRIWGWSVKFVPILFVISTSSMLILDQRTMQIKYRSAKALLELNSFTWVCWTSLTIINSLIVGRKTVNVKQPEVWGPRNKVGAQLHDSLGPASNLQKIFCAHIGNYTHTLYILMYNAGEWLQFIYILM